MFSYIEVENLDPDLRWVELLCEDDFNETPTRLRLVIGDVSEMVVDFRRRYQSKHQVQVNFSSMVIGQLNTFFQDLVHAKSFKQNGQPSDELMKVARTNVVNFKNSLKTTLKKSLSARVNMFLEEACDLVDLRDYDKALRRLDWVHLIHPLNEMAFEMKMVLLRVQEKYGECVAVLESWIEAYPQRVEPFLGLGELWLFLDQNQKALDAFEKLLAFSPKNSMGLIGKAQAQLKLGRDFMAPLMKASIYNPHYTNEMVEHSFDFRTSRPDDLVPMSLEALAQHFKIPHKRIIGRALRGVLPFHVIKNSDLLLFSEKEMKAYYLVLKKLGLEMTTEDLSDDPLPGEPEAVQLNLFEDDPTDSAPLGEN